MSAEPAWRVEPVRAQQTHALRQLVLRPQQGVTEVAFAGDDDAGTGHFAAFAPGAPDPPCRTRIVGVATVLRQCPAASQTDDPAEWWRLRGMATTEDYRGRGVGSALVSAVVAHVAAHNGSIVWCYARVSATDFYQKVGFVITGDPWDEPALGPHVAMARPVLPSP